MSPWPNPCRGTNLVRNQYLAAGSKAVWVIDRKAREVYILRAGGVTVLRGTDGVLEDQEMLPGFSLALVALFE